MIKCLYPPFKKKKLVVVFSLLATAMQAQIPEAPKNLQSPNSATFGKYGDVSISPYTGKPDVRIDLFSVSEGNVQIPISLYYDATGVKPDLHGGWTGLNFSLSVQYAVTRRVKDGPDDSNLYPSSLAKLGYLYTFGDLNVSNWTTQVRMKDITDLSLFRDYEPDEFSFSGPGINGKFYFGSDGQWKVLSERPVKVALIGTSPDVIPPFPLPNGSPWQTLNGNHRGHLRGFLITDERGVVYEFGGGNTDYMEYDINIFNQFNDSWICNAWYLKSITRPTGQIVNFSYVRGDFVAQMNTLVYNRKYSVNGSGFLNADCSGSSTFPALSGIYSGRLVSPIYLSEISSSNFTIKFLSSESTELKYDPSVFYSYIDYHENYPSPNASRVNNLIYLYDCLPSSCYPDYEALATKLPVLLNKLKWRKLDKIEVESPSGSKTREFLFAYNNVISERLMLQSVRERSADGSQSIPPHEFTYYTGTLPGYNLSHTDHWGFNNGLTINVSTDYVSTSTYGANFRAPATDNALLRAGSLKSIQYPTGGRSDFISEPHAYRKEVKVNRHEGVDVLGSNQKAGGLRIKEIHNYGADGTLADSRRFYYLSGFNPQSPDTTSLASSGVLAGKVQYWWSDYRPLPGGTFTYAQQVFSSQSVLPAAESNLGVHVGYSEIVELSSLRGWKQQTYSNYDNGFPDEAAEAYLQTTRTAYEPFRSNAFKRGKMLSESDYSQTGQLLYKREILYQPIGSALTDLVRSFRNKRTELCPGWSGNYAYEGTAYLIDARKFLPVEDTHYSYDQDSPSDYTLLAKITAYKPNGLERDVYTTDSKTSKTKIPLGSLGNVYDRLRVMTYTYADDLSGSAHMGMTSQHMIGLPLEIDNRLAVAGSTNFNYTPLKWQKVHYGLQGSTYLPSKVETQLGSASTPTTDIEFLTYDARGNLLTYRGNDGVAQKREYYGTGSAGKVDLLWRHTPGDGSSIAQLSTYDHRPLTGIQSIQDANSKTLYYQYDAFGRLSEIRNTNSSGAIRAAYCYNYAGQTVPCTALAPTGSIAASTLSLIPNESSPPLPVSLMHFQAEKVEEAALLTWTTTEELNSDHFLIERSREGTVWATIGRIEAAGESQNTSHYRYTDDQPGRGLQLYRLKMTDRDGTFTYSPIESLQFGGDAILYPNPVSVGELLNFRVEDLSKIKDIRVYGAGGTLQITAKPSQSLDVNGLSSGLYMVQITYTDGSVTTHRIIKQ